MGRPSWRLQEWTAGDGPPMGRILRPLDPLPVGECLELVTRSEACGLAASRRPVTLLKVPSFGGITATERYKLTDQFIGEVSPNTTRHSPCGSAASSLSQKV